MVSSDIRGEVFLEGIDNLAVYFAKKELKRQVYDRMFTNDMSVQLMTRYAIHPIAKERIDEELRKASSELPENTGFQWANEKKTKVQENDQEGNSNSNLLEIECDFYAKIASAREPVSLRLLLSDVRTEFKCLNGQVDDHDLEEGDWMWMEVAETANLMKNKMDQLERAFRFMSHHEPESLPKCTVVCLNGEADQSKQISDHAHQL